MNVSKLITKPVKNCQSCLGWPGYARSASKPCKTFKAIIVPGKYRAKAFGCFLFGCNDAEFV